MTRCLLLLLLFLLSGCASEERRMQHHYLHEKGLMHGHQVGQEPLPLDRPYLEQVPPP